MKDTPAIIKLSERSDLFEKAADWFHEKWQVPTEAYLESMENSLQFAGVPEWYVFLDEKGDIVAGLGVIENDFHKRPDLTPNICAVYVEEQYRGQGIARELMDNACEELAKHGIKDVYLITSHTDFYERCGWTFYGMIEEDDGNFTRAYSKKT
jgi:ribosomal protein S18 acetylase RimI-like enzyme